MTLRLAAGLWSSGRPVPAPEGTKLWREHLDEQGPALLSSMAISMQDIDKSVKDKDRYDSISYRCIDVSGGTSRLGQGHTIRNSRITFHHFCFQGIISRN